MITGKLDTVKLKKREEGAHKLDDNRNIGNSRIRKELKQKIDQCKDVHQKQELKKRTQGSQQTS